MCFPLGAHNRSLFLKGLCYYAQELRKKVESERSLKEQFERQLQTVKDEVAAALHAAQQDAAAAQQQVGIRRSLFFLLAFRHPT